MIDQVCAVASSTCLYKEIEILECSSIEMLFGGRILLFHCLVIFSLQLYLYCPYFVSLLSLYLIGDMIKQNESELANFDF